MTSKLLYHPAVFPHPACTCINPLDTLFQPPNPEDASVSNQSPCSYRISLAELDDSMSVSLHLLQVSENKAVMSDYLQTLSSGHFWYCLSFGIE